MFESAFWQLRAALGTLAGHGVRRLDSFNDGEAFPLLLEQALMFATSNQTPGVLAKQLLACQGLEGTVGSGGPTAAVTSTYAPSTSLADSVYGHGIRF
jgi:hypothetical protein